MKKGQAVLLRYPGSGVPDQPALIDSVGAGADQGSVYLVTRHGGRWAAPDDETVTFEESRESTAHQQLRRLYGIEPPATR